MSERKVIKTIRLAEPVVWGSETISEITIYKARGKDMRVLINSQGDKAEEATLNFASKVTLQPIAVLDELDGDDWLAVMEAVGELAERGQKTGLNS